MIGQLKGRFQSLRGNPTVISGKETQKLVVFWIRTCSVLHNLLLEDGYDSNWENGVEDPDRIASDDSTETLNQILPYMMLLQKEKEKALKPKCFTTMEMHSDGQCMCHTWILDLHVYNCRIKVLLHFLQFSF